ncbi:MAG: hypothetical protein QXI07_07140, partial [Pyrobaculum sp.]
MGPCILLVWSREVPGGLPDRFKKLPTPPRRVARWWPPQYKLWRSFNPLQWALEAKEECGLA